MRVLLDKLEEKMKDTAVEGTIGSLFAGGWQLVLLTDLIT